jgi:imidazolonepropionase-like amidohydrolase
VIKRAIVGWGLCSLLVLALAPGPGEAIGKSRLSESLVIQNGRLHTMTRGVIEGGVVLIRNGRIAAFGNAVDVPAGSEVIDASGLDVFPGPIDGFTNLGAADIEPENRDHDEASSPLTPHLRITDALNPGNRFIALARKRGITNVLCAPGESNLLSGQSALIHLSGHGLEDMVIKFPVALHGNMGEIPKMYYGAKNRYPSTRMGEAALLRQTLLNTRAYMEMLKQPKPPDRDLKLESLIPVLEGELPLMVRANRMDDILTMLRIADEYGIQLILNHGSDAHRVADRLAARRIPVIVGPFAAHQMREETARATLEGPARLAEAGVKFAFQTGDFHHYGELIFQAETAVKHGLSSEEAWKALTIHPAQIFGVEAELGSLEEGKLANLVIFQGDPLKSVAALKLIIIQGEIL